MRARSIGLGAALALVVAFAPARAAADDQTCQPADNLSTCFSSDNLWVHDATSPWASIARSQATPSESLSVGLSASYLHRPVGLSVASPDPEGTTIYAVEHVLSATLLTSLGITPRLSLDMAMPFALFQDGATKADVVGSDDVLPRSAIGDLRFGPRFTLLERWHGDDGAGLALRFQMTAPTGTKAGFFGAATAAYAPGATFDYRLADLRLGADVGVRIRDAVKFAGAVIGPQLSLALGGSYDVLDDGWLAVSTEVFALYTTHEQFELVSEPGDFTADEEPSGKPLVPIEWLLSVRNDHFMNRRVHLTVAGGSFIPITEGVGVTTPAFRTFAAVGYRFTPLPHPHD